MMARSCSSFVVMGSETKSGNIVYAKNSDRPFNESQPLIYYPAADHPEGSYTECPFYKNTAGTSYIRLHRFETSFFLGL